MSHILTNIKDFISENVLSQTKDFTYEALDKDNHRYTFSVDDIDYVCVIYPNPWRTHYYDVSFIKKGGSTKERIGKGLKFMNTVLNTVADCVKHFISLKEKIRIIGFDGDRLRTRTYIRFFTRHPYFSQFEIDDSFTKSGFVEIHINKSPD